ncbi:MAG: HAMP domain-containing protein, partial [Deltaproteobacteria bacterium]|nr:HAMP domain-containing protein [Deltaproteobacteria bacterium]
FAELIKQRGQAMEGMGSTSKQAEIMNEMRAQARLALAEAEAIRVDQKAQLAKGREESAAFVVDKLAKADDANRMIKWFIDARKNEKEYIISGGEQKWKDNVDEQVAKIMALSEDVKSRFKHQLNIDQIDEFMVGIEAYSAAFGQFSDLMSQQSEAEGFMVVAARQVEKIGNEARADQKAKMEREIASANLVLLAAIVVSLIIGIVMAFVITRGITKPVNAALSMAQAIEGRDLSVSNIDDRGGDELGMMATALNSMKNGLRDNMGQILQSSEQIASATNQISAGNQDLSQRVQEQASAIEETAATIEEMTSSVKQNADNAKQANEMAAKTAKLGNEGGEVVKEAVGAMGKVQESSKKINEIIDVVNEIAFQTNLLALNAAVEAARAGDAGKGFAVVAGEVRSLAGRSADAAKEIQTLIKESVIRVDEGNQLVTRSGESLTEIIQNIDQVAETISEIAASSQEQTGAIDQINVAVSQLDEVTQQNASLVEETASAAEEMSAEAQAQQDMVSRFKLGQEAAVRRPALEAPRAAAAPPRAAKAAPPRAKKAAEPMIAGPEAEAGDDFLEADEGFEKF